MKKFSIFSVLVISVLIHGYAQTIERYTQIENDTIYLSFINPFQAPIELHLTPLDSVKSFVRVKPYAILKPNDTLKNGLIIPFKNAQDTTSISVTDFIRFNGSFGDPNSIIDKNYKYALPYPKGKRYKIIQSFGGSFSHNKPSSRYAIDFGTQIGDTITAARPGTVVFIKEDSKEYCKTRKCIDKGNKIIIIHDDGSLAHYVHLDYNGALVEVGERVKDSQPIAISGMTGFTTTPHLHFVVFKAGSISIPIRFKGQKSKKLKKDKFYRRKH